MTILGRRPSYWEMPRVRRQKPAEIAARIDLKLKAEINRMNRYLYEDGAPPPWWDTLSIGTKTGSDLLFLEEGD